MSNNQKGIIYALVTAFMWGFLAIALKIAVREVEPKTIVWFRFAIAFTILFVWQLIRKPSSLKILYRPPLLLIVAALGLSWNYLGFMLGIHYTTPSNAQLVIQFGPMSLALAGIFFFKEKIRKPQIIGFLLAAIGFVFFYSQQIKMMVGHEARYNMGVLFTLSSALAWVIYAIMQKKLVVNYSTGSLNLFLFGLPLLIYLPFVDFAPLAELSWAWWLLLIFLGFNTLIAYGCISQALKYTEANKVSIIIIMNPMITFIVMGILTELSVSWIDPERFSVLSLIGAAVVLTGAVLVVRKKSRGRTNASKP